MTTESQPDQPSSVAVATHTLRIDSPTVAGRQDLDVWSDPNEIVAVDTAPDGSVWTTGPGGTTNWDITGSSATVFTVDNGLASSRGRAVSVSTDGTVFVAHGALLSERGNGISVFDGESWSHHTTANGLPSDYVYDLETAADGTVWAATDSGLAYFDQGTWHVAAGSPGAYDLALAPTGQLRAQTEDGVAVLDSSTQWRIVAAEPAASGAALSGEGAIVDRDGGSWLPMWGVAMVHSTPAGIEVHVVDEFLEEYQQAAESGEILRAVRLPGLRSVLGATVTSDGEVWALGAPGILRLLDGEWLRVEGEGLSDATLYDVRADGTGGHWLATDRGLVHLEHDGAATSFALSATVGNLTNHVAIGPAGVFASSISRRAGAETVTVSRLDGGSWTGVGVVELTRIEPSSELDHFGLDQDGYPVVFSGTAYRLLDGSDWADPAAPYPRTLTRPTVDGNGTLWAYAGDALWYLSDGEWHILADSGAWNVTGLAPRPGGGVWLSTWDEGVFGANTNGMSEVPTGALDMWRITSIVAGRDGSLWLAGNSSAGTELAHWDGSGWTLVPVPSWDGAFDWITCMTVGPEGAVWIGDGEERSRGFGSGVARFAADTWTRFGNESGLPSLDVYSVAVDDDGALWVGTDSGVARLSGPATEVEVPSPTTTTATFAAGYSIAAYGVMPNPFPDSGGYFGSGCTPGTDNLPDGIWFGFVRDVTRKSIAFDLACLRWIEDPNEDAFEEGGWDLSNTNPKIRNVPVARGAEATCPWANCPQQRMTYVEWMERTSDYLAANPEATEWSEGHQFGVMVWLYVNGGSVTEIAEPVLAG